MAENSENKVVIEFEDGSSLEVSQDLIECAKMKYGLAWEDYWRKFKEVVDTLWSEGKVLTKFGVKPIDYAARYFRLCKPDLHEPIEITRARHAEMCIYSDLRPCILAKAFASIGKDVKVVAVHGGGRVGVYSGEGVEERSFDELFGELGNGELGDSEPTKSSGSI